MSDPEPADIVKRFKQMDEAEQRKVLENIEHLSVRDAFAVLGAWYAEHPDQFPVDPMEIEPKDE